MDMKLHFSLLVTASLLSVSCLSHAGTSADLSTGYYLGWGDGATVALHIKPRGRFVIYAKQGVGPFIGLHDALKSGVKNTGELERLNKSHYNLLFNTTKYEHKLCGYSLRYQPKYAGWSLHPLNNACVWYHGASWGYGTVSNKHLLKKSH